MAEEKTVSGDREKADSQMGASLHPNATVENKCSNQEKLPRRRESRAGFVGAMLVSIFFTALALCSPAMQPRNSLILEVVAVCIVGGALVFTWPAFARSSHPRATQMAMGFVLVAAVAAFTLSSSSLLWITSLIPASVFLSFIVEMVRKDGREKLVESASSTFMGCLFVLATVLWLFSLQKMHDTIALVSVCCALMIGTLGRYSAGPFRLHALDHSVQTAALNPEKSASSKQISSKQTSGKQKDLKEKTSAKAPKVLLRNLILKSFASTCLGAFAGFYALVLDNFYLSASDMLRVVGWVLLLGITFGAVSGFTDYTRRGLSCRKSSLVAGLLPISALGFILYGFSLLMIG